MNKNEFIIGEKYSYQGQGGTRTYKGQSESPYVGIFKSPFNEMSYNEYKHMLPYTKAEPQYPNPPLPHCEERIAFAKGANIEFQLSNNEPWHYVKNPKWQPSIKHRVKVEKTKDDLRIEELERYIFNTESAINVYKKELAELKPTVHY
tara:strand:- start:6817 stop:7260 length:444 start_codon:yes stop_codon:yes gene_type:complete